MSYSLISQIIHGLYVLLHFILLHPRPSCYIFAIYTFLFSLHDCHSNRLPYLYIFSKIIFPFLKVPIKAFYIKNNSTKMESLFLLIIFYKYFVIIPSTRSMSFLQHPFGGFEKSWLRIWFLKTYLKSLFLAVKLSFIHILYIKFLCP